MRGKIDARAIVAMAVTIATFTISSSSTRAPDRTNYTGKLVSVQDLQTDYGDMCYSERVNPFEENDAFPAGNLFDAFDEPVQAGQARGGGGQQPRYAFRPPRRDCYRHTRAVCSAVPAVTSFPAQYPPARRHSVYFPKSARGGPDGTTQ